MKNDKFKNPKGWAEKDVGSLVRYRLMQSVGVILGVCLAGILFMICQEARFPLFVHFSILVFLLIGVIQLPLFYLRALRSFVIESRSRRSDEKTNN